MKKLNIIIILFLYLTTMNAQNNDYRRMIEAAVKAPSGHNKQPWLFKISENSITILPDLSEALPVVDADNRELYISLGAAAENICVMGSLLGYSVHKEVDESSKEIRVVLLKLDEEAESSPLAAEINKRQTNRSVYNGLTIAADTISLLSQMPMAETTRRYIVSREDTLFASLRQYIHKGNELQMNDESFKRELLENIRFNGREVAANPTGLTYKVMGSPSLPAFVSKPLVKSFLKPDKQNKSDMKKVDSSSHLVLFTTLNNTFSEWVNLGGDLQLFLLEATRLGIVNAYMNQPCETSVLANDMRKNITLINGEYPTLLLRIGYATPRPYSPRKPIDDVIVVD